MGAWMSASGAALVAGALIGCASGDTEGPGPSGGGSAANGGSAGDGASAGGVAGGGAGGAGGQSAGGSAGEGGAGGAAGSGGSGGSGGECTTAPSLDVTFGTNGVAQVAMVGAVGGTASDADRDYGRAIAVAPGGDIVFGGEWYGTAYDFAMTRLSASGSLVGSFGTGGRLTAHGFGAPAPIRGVAIDGSGNIVVASALNNGVYGIARLNGQGAPDTSFGGSGFVTTTIVHPVADSVTAFQPVGVQSDGKVIIGGRTNATNSDFAIARYGNDGLMDATFGSGGTATLAVSAGPDIITSLRVLSDDRIVVAGVGDKNALYWEAGEFAVAVFSANGTPDATFNGTGFASVSVYPEGGRPNGVTMQADGKVVAIGCMSCDYNYASKVDTVVVRFLATGPLDTSFDSDGIKELAFDSLIDIGYDVVEHDDKLVISGGKAVQQQVGKMYVARLFTSNGALDECFGVFSSYPTQGFAGNDQAFSLEVLLDGSILAAGATGDSSWGDFAVMKIIPE